MGPLREMQRDRTSMTDPITCPECQGAKGERLGELFLACQFCHGRGWVGGDHEPAETPPPPAAPPPAWEHKVWGDSYIAAALPCRRCLGSGRLAHVDEETHTLTTGICPCQTGA